MIHLACHRENKTRIRLAPATGGNAVAEERLGFAYNALEQFSTISRYAKLAGTQLVVTSSYSCNNG